MHSRSRRARWFLGLGGFAAIVGALLFVAWAWVIPAVIVAEIRKEHRGHVAIRGWWVGWKSAGVTGLVLRETPAADSPAWAIARAVSTDLSIGGLVRGKTTPKRVSFFDPNVTYRIGEDGKPLTKLPLKQAKGKPTPTLIVARGRLTMAQEGRPPLIVEAIGGRLDPEKQGARFDFRSRDAGWGSPTVVGRFTPDFKGFNLRLTADPLPADRDRIACIPFVSEKVWKYFEPTGPARVVVDYDRPADRSKSSEIKTVVDFEGTRILLPSLELLAEGAVGRMTYKDKVVALDRMRGRMLDGRVEVGGTLDFRDSRTSRYVLTIDIEDGDVMAIPASWSLEALTLGGRLTGKARLHMGMTERGLDVTGSTGRGVIDRATVRGLPLGRLGLSLRGEGLRDVEQDPVKGHSIFRPQRLGSHFEVRDVDLVRAVALVRSKRGVREVPVSGRLGLGLDLQLPLGTLYDVKAYRGEGRADLAAATIGGVTLGRLAGRLALANGVLDVDEVRGRLAARPDPATLRPDPAEPPPLTGPLPDGGFRGRFRADLAGGRQAEAAFEGHRLPLSGLTASPDVGGIVSLRARAEARGESPSDPRAWSGTGRVEGPEVTYGSATFRDVTALLTLEDGQLNIAELVAKLGDHPFTGRGAVDLKAPHPYRARLEADDLPLSELVALGSSKGSEGADKAVAPAPTPHPGPLPQGGREANSKPSPLAGEGWVGGGTHKRRDTPSQDKGKGKSKGKPSVSGKVAARAEVEGTLSPWRFASRGRARIDQAEAEKVPLGNVPIAWETIGPDVVVTARELQRYGGRLDADARVPVQGDRPIVGTVTLRRVDTARLSAEVPGSLALTGLADGRATFRLPFGRDDSPVEAEARLSASEMTVEGIPARSLRATLVVRDGVPKFEAHAEALQGSFEVKGAGRPGEGSISSNLEANVRGARLQLAPLLAAIGGGSDVLAKFEGEGAVAARAWSTESAGGLHAEGSAEVRELAWHSRANDPLGRVRADFAIAPGCWRVGHLDGTLWDGPVRGEFWRKARGGDGDPMRYGLDLRLERISLARLLGFAPEVARRFHGSGSFVAKGHSEGSYRGRAEFRVDRGTANHLPISKLSIPIDWDLRQADGLHGTVRVHRASARLDGGTLQGEATVRLGLQRGLDARLMIDQIDMRLVSRLENRVGRPMPGKLDGVITLNSPDAAHVHDYTGDINLTLTGAALVDIPILDAIDDALGSARGTVFDAGDMRGKIEHRAVHVERLTLVGPLALLHASGTIDLESGKLDLRAFINAIAPHSQSSQVAAGRMSDVERDLRLQEQAIDDVARLVTPNLMKYRIKGTLAHPTYYMDGSIHADEIILTFFVDALRTMRLRAGR